MGTVTLLPPAVVMVIVAVTGEVPVRLSEGGDDVQEMPGAATGELQFRFSSPVNPFRGVIVSVAVPDCPGVEMFTLVGLTDTLKSVTLTVTGAEVDPV